MSTPFDYSDILATAQDLIASFGRNIQINKIGTAVADPAMPWRGPLDAQSPLEDSQTLPAVETGLLPKNDGEETSKKDIPDNTKNYYLVVPGANTPDLRQYDQIVDGGRTLAIIDVYTIQPGPVVLLYQFTVEK